MDKNLVQDMKKKSFETRKRNIARRQKKEHFLENKLYFRETVLAERGLSFHFPKSRPTKVEKLKSSEFDVY